MEERVREAHCRLTETQQNLLQNPCSQLAHLEKEAHAKWISLAIAEERFLQQRSRVLWLDSGDLNTEFFHRMVATRRSGNQIHYLMDSQGNRLIEVSAIKSHCVDYYQNLFAAVTSPLDRESLDQVSSLTAFRCTDNIKTLLQAPVSAEDIKREVFAIPHNKTPGPDGYTGEFYRKTWDVLGGDLVAAVQEFFRTGKNA